MAEPNNSARSIAGLKRLEHDIVAVRMLVRVWQGLHWSVGAASLGAGLIYLLGPPRFRVSSVFDVFTAIGLSDRVWPAMLVLAASLACAGRSTRLPWWPGFIGHIGCGIALAWYALISALAWFDPTQHTAGGPAIYLGLACAHWLAAYSRLAQRRLSQGQAGGDG